jgi:hypothetical protein
MKRARAILKLRRVEASTATAAPHVPDTQFMNGLFASNPHKLAEALKEIARRDNVHRS